MALWFGYVVLTTLVLVLFLERRIRVRTSGLNTLQRAFIAFPAVSLLGSMVTYVIFHSQNNDPITNALLLAGLISIIILPITVASPIRSFWRHIPAVWCLYGAWFFFVFFPHMLYCGVPFRD